MINQIEQNDVKQLTETLLHAAKLNARIAGIEREREDFLRPWYVKYGAESVIHAYNNLEPIAP